MRRRLGAEIAAVLGLLIILVGPSAYENNLERAAFNFRQELFSAPAPSTVLIGGIDEQSLEVLGPFPWDRSYYALLLEDLYARGAKGVFLDLIFDRETPEDALVADAAKMGVTVVAGAVEHGAQGPTVPVVSPPIAEAAEVGVINKSEDEDDVVRYGWLAIAVDHSSWPEQPILSPAFYLFLQSRGIAKSELEFKVNGLPLDTILPNAFDYPLGRCPGEIIAGGVSIPVSVSVNQSDEAVVFLLPISYSKPQTTVSPPGKSVVSFSDLPETEVKDKFIFIGENTATDTDVVKTPMGRMKGVEAHAQTFAALVNGRYLRKGGEPWLVNLFLAIALAVLFHKSHRGRTILIECLVVSGVILASNLVAFSSGLWLPLIMPISQVFLTGVLLMLFRTEMARRTFASLTTKEAAHEMLVSDGGEELEATTVTATIIVSDIRGYTTLSETRTPVQMVELLNQYHTETVAIYERYGGRALTYQGDAQLIVFGYPNKIKNAAKASVQAAVGLQEAVVKLRKLWNVSDDTFSVGAACCTGSVAIGRLGAKGAQIQYTVIGDPVRRAHKIQSLSGDLDSPVLMDPETAAEIGDGLNLESLGVIEVPGLDQPLELHRPKS